MTYYVKNGRRYVPVAEHCPEASDRLHHGDYLLSVYLGGRSLRRIEGDVSPEVAAAIGRLRSAMVDAMRKANELRPSTRSLTPAQVKAFARLRADLSSTEWPLAFDGASMADVVEAGLRALMAGMENGE